MQFKGGESVSRKGSAVGKQKYENVRVNMYV